VDVHASDDEVALALAQVAFLDLLDDMREATLPAAATRHPQQVAEKLETLSSTPAALRENVSLCWNAIEGTAEAMGAELFRAEGLEPKPYVRTPSPFD